MSRRSSRARQPSEKVLAAQEEITPLVPRKRRRGEDSDIDDTNIDHFPGTEGGIDAEYEQDGLRRPEPEFRHSLPRGMLGEAAHDSRSNADTSLYVMLREWMLGDAMQASRKISR